MITVQGFVGIHRQFMFIVAHVEKEGLAGGSVVALQPVWTLVEAERTVATRA